MIWRAIDLVDGADAEGAEQVLIHLLRWLRCTSSRKIWLLLSWWCFMMYWWLFLDNIFILANLVLGLLGLLLSFAAERTLHRII